MQIRIATEADIPAMHRIRTSVLENRLSDPSSVSLEDYRLMMGERGRGWIAEVDGRMAGFAIADRTRSNVWALFVDPVFEGRGVGRELHRVMMDWLFDSGEQTVWLTTTPGTRAERFYQSARWQYAGPADGEVRYEMTAARWKASSEAS